MLSKKRVIFRVDSSQTIGSGHIQRCITFAELLRKQEVESLFVSRRAPGDFCDWIEGNGFPLTLLPEEIQGEAQEASFCFQLSQKSGGAGWIILDHYRLGHQFEAALRQQSPAIKIAVIDDLANRIHDCDVLIDTNLHREGARIYQSLTPPNCKKFVGPEFAFLREQFLMATSLRLLQKRKLENILVFFGGSDPSQETLRFLKEMEISKIRTYHILVSNGCAGIEEILKVQRPDVIVHRQPEDLAGLMAKCDFYVGSGGTITWERFYMGLPGLVITVASNQVEVAKALMDQDLQFYWGTKEQVQYRELPKILDDIEKNKMHILNAQIAAYVKMFHQPRIEEVVSYLVSNYSV